MAKCKTLTESAVKGLKHRDICRNGTSKAVNLYWSCLLHKLPRAHQEMRYPNMTWHTSSYLSTCHWTIKRTQFTQFRNILESNAYLLHIMDVALRKAPCLSLRVIIHFRVSIINDYLACSLLIHKICALCGIFSAISFLLTTENSDDLEIRVSDGSRSLKVTPVNFSWLSLPISHQLYSRPYLVPLTYKMTKKYCRKF